MSSEFLGCRYLFQGAYNIPQPKSPDPDIPEWDWGDSSQDKVCILCIHHTGIFFGVLGKRNLAHSQWRNLRDFFPNFEKNPNLQINTKKKIRNYDLVNTHTQATWRHSPSI